jgi:hypothetical protein
VRIFSTDARTEPRDTKVMRGEAQRQQEQQTNKQTNKHTSKQTKDSPKQKKSVTYKGMRGAHCGFSSTSPPLSWARACICDVGKHGRLFQYGKRIILLFSAIKGPGPDRL